MRTTAKAALAAAGVLLLCGHALSQDIRIPRKGSSPGIEKRHYAHRDPPRHGRVAPSREKRSAWHCRGVANKARLAQEHAKKSVVVGFLAGGLIGAIITSSKNGEAYERDVWRQAYDRCRARWRHADNDDDD